MNKRCIVNVATGDFYCKMQERLMTSFEGSVDWVTIANPEFQPMVLTGRHSTSIDMMLWRDCLPTGSRPHAESPYGFKVHAIKAAYEKGYTSILWLDSPAYAVKEDISPIFDKIEKHGYYAMSHIDPLENWVGDRALHFFDLRREALSGLNLPSGSCYGFDLSESRFIGPIIFNGLKISERFDLFKSEKISANGWHRHDEAILALQLLSMQYPVFTFDPLFQSDSPECIIRSGDFGPMEQARATA